MSTTPTKGSENEYLLWARSEYGRWRQVSIELGQPLVTVYFNDLSSFGAHVDHGNSYGFFDDWAKLDLQPLLDPLDVVASLGPNPNDLKRIPTQPFTEDFDFSISTLRSGIDPLCVYSSMEALHRLLLH